MLPESFEELKHTGDLPSPSGVGMRILVLTQQEDCALDDVVAAIQADPALTGRIIKLASSAQLGSSVPIGTAKEAALRLGLKSVCSVALGFTLVAGNRSGRCAAFDYDRYWSWSLANASAAAILAAELGLGDSAEAFTCALLVRVGELALASVHPSDYSDVLVKSRKKADQTLLELERSRFMIDHAEAAAAMMLDWGLPERYAHASMAYLDVGVRADFDKPEALWLLNGLTLSGAFADYCLAAEDEREEALRKALKLAEEHNVSAERVDALLANVTAEWQEWGEVLNVPTFIVPLAAELRARLDKAEVAQDVVDEVRSNGLRILAVDDDAVSLRLLERHLQAAGHTVVTATNGKQAMAAALETSPQLVITDWMMPEMNGLQLCKALRRFTSGRGMYVLLLTGRGEEDRIVEAFDAGVDDYIVKPFKPKLLLARIRAGIRVVELQHQVELDKKLQREQLAKLAVLNRKLRAAALTDPLTELPNRRYAMKRLETEWSSWARSGQPLSVLMVDIDHFKQVNDSHGHDIGDLVLRETARAMGSTLRRSDTCARIGGEEFLVISPNTDREGASSLAERIRAEVETTTMKNGSFDGSVTVSIGVTTMNAGAEVGNVEELLKLVDNAIYRAKQSGRNRWAEGHPPDRQKSA
jgi:diguanylate cyclase (GGDEF)-like protein